MGKVPLQVLKELEHQARQNLSTINFTATFTETASSCNTVMEKCQHSIKATFKRVKSQIQKGADPEKAARRGCEHACDYFEIMNRRILIQQRALACLGKSVAHILRRELYTMGNTGLLRLGLLRGHLRPHSRGLGHGNSSPPSDSLQASLSPPVGRLCSLRRDWLANKCSDNVLNIITNGYILPFISKPNLVRAPLIRTGYKALQKDQALSSCM